MASRRLDPWFLTSIPACGALLQERCKSFGSFVRLASGRVAFNQFDKHVVLQIAPGRAQGAGLGLRNSFRSVSQNVIDNALACAVQLSNWHDLVNEPNAISFFNIETFSSERVAPYLAHADGIVELWNNDGAGHPDAHLCYRENSIIGGNHDVTSGNYSSAATETGALHQRYRGNRKDVELLNASAAILEARKLSCGDERRIASSQLMSAPA